MSGYKFTLSFAIVFPSFSPPRKRAELATALRTNADNPDAGLAKVFRRCINLVDARCAPYDLLGESLGGRQGGIRPVHGRGQHDGGDEHV